MGDATAGRSTFLSVQVVTELAAAAPRRKQPAWKDKPKIRFVKIVLEVYIKNERTCTEISSGFLEVESIPGE